MALSDQIRSVRARMERAYRAFNAPPRVPRVGIQVAPIAPEPSSELARILSDRAALEGMISTGAGPMLSRYSTYPATGINPAAIDSILRNADKGITWPFADMGMQVLQRDAHLTGVDRARRVESAGKAFRIQAVNKSPLALAMREYIRAVVDEIDAFDQSIYRLLSANAIGWSALENVYHASSVTFPGLDGKVATVRGLHPRSLEWVHPKHFWFTLDADDPLLDLGPSGKTSLPFAKFIFHGASGDGLYAHRGYMRQAVWLHMLKHNSVRDWAVFLSLFGIPNIYAKVPRNLFENAEFKSVLKVALQEYGQGLPSMVPDTIDIDSRPGPIGSGADQAHARLAAWCNEEQSKLVQGETLTTQTGGTGSYGLGATQEAVKYAIVKMDDVGVCGDLRKQLFRPIVELNLYDLCRVFRARPEEVRAVVPRCSHRIERELGPRDRAEIYKIGVNELGAEIDEDQFLEDYGFDKPRPGGRALRGKPIPISEGGVAVGALEASDGVDNPKPLEAQAGG